ncbi:protein ASPARTIC PROTEASE IN GUARD CELL 1 [Populus alba x Populus x berolinensis]|nr:protein ASPARTIC PROTEASE IN GUARD CELL 1 [Populus alba x Populus x berolinensis]
MTNQLCYIGSVREDLSGFPVVTFHFTNGAQLVLDTQSMFLHIAPIVFCLAIGSSVVNEDNFKNLSVIGMMAKQNYNMGYDIGQNKLYFQRIDCELLED